jgi:signal recognition particle GTPase
LAIDLDLPTGEFADAQTVEVRVVARFGMKANQKAVNDLLGERVEGYWPDLVQLLCAPAELDLPKMPGRPKQFFTDRQPGGASLNEEQRAAVVRALASHHAFCIQGPPGTGKTTVICELVEQLVARGERLLVVASTHPAIDEVLRRIGAKDAVRALRFSWDDTKIAEDVRRFSPAELIDGFLQRLSKTSGTNRKWASQRQALSDAIQRLERLRGAQAYHVELSRRYYEANEHAEQVHETVARDEPPLQAKLGGFTKRIEEIDQQITAIEVDRRAAETNAESVYKSANRRVRALAWIGLGQVALARRSVRHLCKALESNLREQANLRNDRLAAQKSLDDLSQTLNSAKQSLQNAAVAVQQADNDREQAEMECREHALLVDRDLKAASIPRLLEDLRQRDSRLAGYERLGGRFNDLLANARNEGGDLSRLRDDLLAVTNVFCCTTTGVAGTPELRDLSYDTLIVDEASRVTDPEFLIAAVRARRWILVGDEHQLPPYVEQADEHFIHALSALHRSEATGKSLQEAVDELGALWEEDEELHQFRRESVVRVADELRTSGAWADTYRSEYQEGVDLLRTEAGDPSKAMLTAMRESMVHSLFERVVKCCPPAMKVRLVEQRRMIEPIAAIVSEPVYGGDYRTPSAEDLARCGVEPLTTPTFPTAVTFLDTSLLGTKAGNEMDGNGFVNRTEVRWIVAACRTLDKELAQVGSQPISVSILTFYKAQALLARAELSHHQFVKLRFSVIDAVDRIQGQESDLVILSFCRTAGKSVSPRFGQWLQDLRRLNVACTRAHRALILVGQKELLGRLCANELAMTFYRHLDALFDRRPDVMRVVRQFGSSSQGGNGR